MAAEEKRGKKIGKFVPVKELYTVKKQLGGGTYGNVYLVENKKNGKQSALKLMPLSEKNIDGDILNETCIPRMMNHPNVISYSNINFLTRKNKKYVGVEMKVFDRDLNNITVQDNKYVINPDKVFRNERFAKIAYQLLVGLNYISSRNILHCDIKPKNIFYDEKREIAVIGDFGIAQNSFCTRSTFVRNDWVYSLWFRPPEIIGGELYSFKADDWAMGCVLYQIFAGIPLFPGWSKAQMKEQFKQRDGKINHLPEGVRQVIGGLCTIDPDKRKSAFDILTLPFFDSVRSELNEFYASAGVEILASKSCLPKVETHFIPQCKLMAASSIPNSSTRKKIIKWAYDLATDHGISIRALFLAISHYDRCASRRTSAQMEWWNKSLKREKNLMASLLLLTSTISNDDSGLDIEEINLIIGAKEGEIMSVMRWILSAFDWRLDLASIYDMMYALNKGKLYENQIKRLKKVVLNDAECLSLARGSVEKMKKFVEGIINS